MYCTCNKQKRLNDSIDGTDTRSEGQANQRVADGKKALMEQMPKQSDRHIEESRLTLLQLHRFSPILYLDPIVQCSAVHWHTSSGISIKLTFHPEPYLRGVLLITMISLV